MRKLTVLMKKSGRRLLAFALGAVLFASACPAQGFASMSGAATDNSSDDIKLEYIDYLTDADGSRFGIRMLTGNTVRIKMTNDNEYSMAGAGKNALKITRSESSSTGATEFFKADIGTTSDANIYKLTAEANVTGNPDIDTVSETFSVVSNFDSITKAGGYDGRVQASNPGTSGGNVGSDEGKTVLHTSLAISQRSKIVLECTEGEYFGTTPKFIIKDADGAFKDYKSGTSVGTSASSTGLGKLTGSKTVRVSLRPMTTGSDLKTLEISFQQVLSYNDLCDPTGVFQKRKVDDEGEESTGNTIDDFVNVADPSEKASVVNNFFRKGAIYTLIFEPPTSTTLLLQIATPKYVIQEIQNNMEEDKETGAKRKYVLLEGRDTFDLVAEATMKLKTVDKRFNAQFPLTWEWLDENGNEWTDKNKKGVVPIPKTDGTEEVTVTFNPLVEDVQGTLVATIHYKNDTTKENYPDDATKDICRVEFPIKIRGTGTRGTIQPFSQRTGREPVEPDNLSYIYKSLLGTAARPQVTMDVFAGGVPDYKKNPSDPFEYVLQLNMGAGNAKAKYALAKLEMEPADPADTQVVSLSLRPDPNPLKETVENEDGTTSEVEKKPLQIDDSNDKDYTPGEQIANTYYEGDYKDEEGNEIQGTRHLVVTAAAAGTATLTLEYHVIVNGEDRVDSTHEIKFVVKDTSPSQDATLSDIIVQDSGAKETFPFGFSPSVLEYSKSPLALPYAYSTYKIFPITNDTKAENKIEIMATDLSGNNVTDTLLKGAKGMVAKKNADGSYEPAEEGKLGNPRVELTPSDLKKNGVPLTIEDEIVGREYILYFKVTAQDTNYQLTYVMHVRREEPSKDDTLSLLGVYEKNDTDGKKNLITGFNAKQRVYIVQIPYSTDFVRIAATQNYSRADVKYSPELTKISGQGKKEYLAIRNNKELKEETVPDYGDVKLPCLHVYVTSEEQKASGLEPGEYRIFFERTPPSTDASLKALAIADAADTAAVPKPLVYTPAFTSTNVGPYRLTDAKAVSYTTEKVRFKATPVSDKISKIEIREKGRTKVLATIENPEVYSAEIALKPRTSSFNYNEFEIVVWAEDEKTSKIYTVQIERSQAKQDADLIGMILADEDGKAIDSFKFHRDETEYKITVPYETRKVTFQPTVSDVNASIRLRDNDNLIHTTVGSVIDTLDKLTSGSVSKLYELNDAGKPRKFELIVTAEDTAVTKTYTFTIEREMPSDDALLKKLAVSGLTEDGLSPLFKAKTTEYSGTVAEGAQGVAITPTANEPHAKIQIGDQVLESGKTSNMIELLEEQTLLEVIVTAQDGKTTKTYTLDLFNQNLVEKTSNADLSELKIQTGVMTPEFKASVTEYEVAVKEDTYAVDIIPQTDDPLAEIKVFNGSRELGDYNGNYALALNDGKNDIKVQVTSPDKTVTKEYTVRVYRNEEESLKTLTPLTAEDIDFTKISNPFVISITEFPRIAADVFCELRDNHPEIALILQGADYSLIFNAGSLKTTIPTREIYDFRMTFTSPDEENIYRYMTQWPENDDILNEVAMVYFDYHGDLPGPATLNLTLSNRYGSQNVFWHYYNEDRSRIDYYGATYANAKGAISVPIDHCSTYVVSRVHAIVGAENQEGNLSRISKAITTGTGTNPSASSSGKLNPQTSAGDGA